MRSDLNQLTLGQKLKVLLPFTGLALVLDLAAKWLVLSEMTLMEVRPVTSFFNLVLVENKGAAFSFLSSQGSYQGLKMAGLAIIAMAPLGYFVVESKNKTAIKALGLILGGALGNIHDRLRYDAVVDFLDFYYRDHHWPAFNLADAAIVVGVVVFLVVTLREDRLKNAKKLKKGRF
ncbi:MAG: signal peptidase II [Deltaproteobacteria bacterium]|nr:signal peptidase II [Deltaproteobacteria bacterium]